MSICDKREELEAAGIRVNETLERFMGNEQLMEKFIRRFSEDQTMDKLGEHIAAGNWEEAFKSVHTLKGVAGNLGMMELYQCASVLTEKLRMQDIGGVPEHFTELKTLYDRLIAAIAEL